MRTLVIANQKGGVGKTTLAGHLAVEAERAGAGPVALLDTDSQGSLSDWWNERQAQTPVFAEAALEALGAQLAELEAAGIQIVVIDTPPAVSQRIQTVVDVADLVLIPVRPGPHDLRAVGATVRLVEGAGKRMIFCVNGATPRARITGEAAIALSQHGTVAPSICHQRVDFAASMIDGRTAVELDLASRSGAEISELWRYIFSHLQKC